MTEVGSGPHHYSLAFGCSIEDRGKEIHPRILERIDGIKTPYSFEFARSSNSRRGGPTLIPLQAGSLFRWRQ